MKVDRIPTCQLLESQKIRPDPFGPFVSSFRMGAARDLSNLDTPIGAARDLSRFDIPIGAATQKRHSVECQVMRLRMCIPIRIG